MGTKMGTKTAINHDNSLSIKNKLKNSSDDKLDFQRNEIKLPEILFLTTFPPRECGISNYSQDLNIALKNKFKK